jgi:hypothetical protein
MILAAAVASAVLIGLARGGTLRRLANLPLRWAWVALVAFGLQIYLIYFPEPVSEGITSPRVIVLMFSYMLLLAVVWQNRALPGLWLIGFGLLSNFAVMFLNGGYMPITADAPPKISSCHTIKRSLGGWRIFSFCRHLFPFPACSVWVTC